MPRAYVVETARDRLLRQTVDDAFRSRQIPKNGVQFSDVQRDWGAGSPENSDISECRLNRRANLSGLTLVGRQLAPLSVAKADQQLAKERIRFPRSLAQYLKSRGGFGTAQISYHYVRLKLLLKLDELPGYASESIQRLRCLRP